MFLNDQGASPRHYVQYQPRLEHRTDHDLLVYRATIDAEFLDSMPYTIDELIELMFDPALFDGSGQEMEHYRRQGFPANIHFERDGDQALIVEISFSVPSVERTLFELSR